MIKSSFSDEDLLRMHREGDSMALAELMDRYFSLRHYSIRTVAPATSPYLNEWEQNEIVYHAFYKATQTYDFRDVKLLSYYHIILKHDLVHAATKRRAEAPHGVISLDRYHEYETRGGYTLSDTISSGDTTDDPRAFLNYAETLMEFQKLPPNITPETVTLVELITQGFPLAQASKVLGVEERRARYLIRKYRRWALDTLNRVYRSEEDHKEKEKLLDDFLRWKEDEE